MEPTSSVELPNVPVEAPEQMHFPTQVGDVKEEDILEDMTVLAPEEEDILEEMSHMETFRDYQLSQDRETRGMTSDYL